jgi:tetratricopeptide (TPR) repeat protein
MPNMKDEQDITALIQEENDEQAVRLIYALLDLDQHQIQQRVPLLLALGNRYLALAMVQEDGPSQDETVEALLSRRSQTALFFPPRAQAHDPDGRRVQNWCQEAASTFSAVIQQAVSPQDTRTAYRNRGLAHALLGRNTLALSDLSLALICSSSAGEQAEILYQRGIVLAQQGNLETAHADFFRAFELDPHHRTYQDAKERILPSR